MTSPPQDPQPAFSVVVPAYNEAQSLVELTDRVAAVFHKMGREGNFEILFIDDGSTDSTADIVRQLKSARPYVRGIVLRANHGKSMALMTAFRHARGSYVVTMDADLQDNPEDIPALVARLDEGFDVVSGWRRQRNDGLVRTLGSRLFNRTVRAIGGPGIHDFNCGLKIFRSLVLKRVFVFGQHHRYIPLLAHLNGFKVSEVPVGNSPRKYGESKYPALRYQGLFDLLSILFTYKYSFSPLHFFGTIGAAIAIPSALVLLALVVGHVLFWFGLETELRNRPLLVLSAIGLLVGLNVFLAGFVCDFVLHHAIPHRVDETSDRNIKEIL